MSLTHAHRRALMAMYLRVDPAKFDAESPSSSLYVSPELPNSHGSRTDIALEVEGAGTRVLSIAEQWRDAMSAVRQPSLAAMQAAVGGESDPRMRFGEVYSLDVAPHRMPLPSPYHRASARIALDPDLAEWMQDPIEILIAHRDRVVAAGALHPYEGTPFSGSPIYVAREHRGRGLGKYIISAAAQRIVAKEMVPIALVSDRNSISRRAFRSVGYERAISVGALSINAT